MTFNMSSEPGMYGDTLDTAEHPTTTTLPEEPGQYLFAVDTGPVELWELTAKSGWYLNGIHYPSPLERKPYTTWQRVVRGGAVTYPTLLAIGLGPQLTELERICAESANGKHKGGTVLERGIAHHYDKALSHANQWVNGEDLDADSGASHLVHAAARLLMAAACWDGER